MSPARQLNQLNVTALSPTIALVSRPHANRKLTLYSCAQLLRCSRYSIIMYASIILYRYRSIICCAFYKSKNKISLSCQNLEMNYPQSKWIDISFHAICLFRRGMQAYKVDFVRESHYFYWSISETNTHQSLSTLPCIIRLEVLTSSWGSFGKICCWCINVAWSRWTYTAVPRL